MRLWIDTDIGDDIDDILTISWALKKKTEFAGISTVYRQAHERMRIVKELLNGANANVPLYEGYSSVLSDNALTVGKLNYTSDAEFQGNDPEKAIDAIIDAVKKYDDLIILAIGAQTNVAKACLKDPATMKGAKLVIMGGAFYVHAAEWNIVCDPKAAKIVSETVDDITYVPWDVTRYICIGEENYKKILSIEERSARGVLAGFVKQWSTKNKYIPLLHDPAAYYYCLRPDLYNVIDFSVNVIDEGELTGMSLNMNEFTLRINREKKYPVHKLVVKADNDVIISDFMKDVFEIQ